MILTSSMPQARAVAFDIDWESLNSLRYAFPDWEIRAVDRATASSIDHEWDPDAADLLVVGAREEIVETLSLCRALRSQVGRAHTPLIVLIASAQESLVRAALEAGASGCLRLPVDSKELVAALRRLREGNRPGRHTRDVHPAKVDDDWRDDGAEA